MQIEYPEDTAKNEAVSRTQVEALTDLVLDQFPVAVAHRKIGLRTSFPIVGKDGRAGDSGTLWPFLRGDEFQEQRERNGMLSALVGDSYAFSVTAGRGMMEVQIPPCVSVHELAQRLYEAVDRLIPAAAHWKQAILAYGGQPQQTMDQHSLTHKYEYFSLLRKLKESYCYQGIQALGYIDLSVSRGDLLEQFNLGHLLTYVFAGLSARSPIFGGEDSFRPSGRLHKQFAMAVGDGRWQMIETPYSGMDEWVFHLLHQPHLLCRDEEGWLDPAQGAFSEYSSGKYALELWDDFLDHADTLWTSAQPKLRKSVLQFAEIEQCGPELQVGFCALALGLAEQGPAVVRFLEDMIAEPPAKREFGLWPIDILNRALAYRRDIWTPLQESWLSIVSAGKLPEPCTGFFTGILRYAEEGLIKRGLGEEVYLRPIRDRIHQRETDTNELRRLWISNGVDALIERCTIRQAQ